MEKKTDNFRVTVEDASETKVTGQGEKNPSLYITKSVQNMGGIVYDGEIMTVKDTSEITVSGQKVKPEKKGGKK